MSDLTTNIDGKAHDKIREDSIMPAKHRKSSMGSKLGT